jgi:hypothetical protein
VADVNSIASYIYNRSRQVGVDPNLALGIARYEGLNPNTLGSPTFGNRDAKGYSFGPFQLYSGSADPSRIAPGGMAYEFQQRFGEAPSASNWEKQVDFALDTMRRRGVSPWYAVRDQGGPEAITQKGAQFARQIGLDGGAAVAYSPRSVSEDQAQIGSPAAPTPQQQMAQPVYANNFSTAAQRFGNFLAPSMVEAPQPLAPDQAQAQIAEQRAMQSGMSQANDAMRAFAALSSLGAAQEAQANRPMSLLQPSIMRGRVTPITIGRGLL